MAISKVSLTHQACLHAGWPLLYKHTAELMCLDFCRPAVLHMAPQLMWVYTPLVLEAWDQALSTHPDQAYARYIRNGLRHGFRVGFQHGSPLRSATRNMPSADQHPESVDEYMPSAGIVIDTLKGELRLPEQKLQRLRDLLREWGNRKSCTRKELESLIGLLNRTCKVVWSGRSFLRRMIDLLHAIHHPPNSKTPIRFSPGFRADLAWWQEFLVKWNGVSFLHPPSCLPTIELTTDVSGWSLAWKGLVPGCVGRPIGTTYNS